MKTLIIAEKPSVASDIAKTLGGFVKHDEYFESESYVVSSAVGHLLELVPPEDFEVKRGKWSFAHLPVIPPQFALSPVVKTESRLKALGKLMKRKDIIKVINACDAGREGELIFRYIVQYLNAKQPISRLWLQSMTPQAIRDGFAHLRSDQDMSFLADAARCRSEADWLIGINSTRAMTAFNSKEGGFFLTTVGRVQTPTLSIVVTREEAIRRFVVRQYFEIHAQFGAQKGSYPARWIDPGFSKNEQDSEQKAERIWDAARVDAIVTACQGKTGTVREDTKPSSKGSPLLFDLTSLQREANNRFGFSAKNTLGLAQALYERHKVLTYPRTNSRHLPEDYLATVNETLTMLSQSGPYQKIAKTITANKWVKPTKKVFDNQKITDHFAIIPTTLAPKNLSEAEQKLYDFVVRRFLAVFYPASEYLLTTRMTEVAGHTFKSEGKILLNPGWLEVYGKEGQGKEGQGKEGQDKNDDDGAQMVAITAGESVKTIEVERRVLHTKPPARLTEATLLTAMEGAGKMIEDEELRSAMSEKGLGTPATRAAIIEGLLAEQYLLREGRELCPTAKAFQLMTLLRGLDIPELTAPELTGEWEYKLTQMERGKMSRATFMQEIGAMTQKVVDRAKTHTNDTISGDYVTLTAPCPACGKVVKENYRRFACTACEFSISKHPAGRNFELPEVETLLRDRVLGPLQGFRSKLGRMFAAKIIITPAKETGNLHLEFDFGNASNDEATPVDLSTVTAVGPCPKCQHQVYDLGLNYACEQQVAPERKCDFRSGKIILQQEVVPAQMTKLLVDGRTDLLVGFVSQRTRRAFKAFLVRTGEGKVSFEFEVKAPKAGKAATKAKAGSAAKNDVGASAGAASEKSSKVTASASKPAGKTASKTTSKVASKAKPATPKKRVSAAKK